MYRSTLLGAVCILIITLPSLGQVSVVTYHNDNSRTGQNLAEVTLTPSNVTTGFGKLFTIPVDDWIVAQPLYVPNLNIGGGTHNVIFVATLNNTVYAIDADTPTTTYWSQNYGAPTSFAGLCQDSKYQNAPHGGAGIVSTPVIDATLGSIFFVTKTGNGSTGSPYALTFYAVNISTGATVASTTVNPGAFDWNPYLQMSRPALAEDPTGSYIYVGLGATGCQDFEYEHGYVMAYSTTTGTLAASFATTAGANNNGGIWQGGAGLALDSAGDIYFETADANSNGKTAYGDSIVKINTGANNLTILDYFTPYNQATLHKNDLDLASVGPLILPQQQGPYPDLLVGSGKTEEIYVVDRDKMGKYRASGNTNIPQYLPTLPNLTGCSVKVIGSSTGATCRNGAPVYFNNGTNSFVYLIDDGQSSPASLSFPCDVLQYTLTNGSLSTTPTAQGFFGTNCLMGSPSISANGSTNGILWFVQSKGTATALHAVDPTTLAQLYNSNVNVSRDSLGLTARFVTPTIANGKVYVGGKGDLVVYGLLSLKGASHPVRSVK
jgi:hypothetical protein